MADHFTTPQGGPNGGPLVANLMIVDLVFFSGRLDLNW